MNCRICGKPLTGEGAFLGIGPVCRKHRAEAMQLHLVESSETVANREEWRNADNFEIVNFESMQQETGKSTNGGEPIEVFDFDLIRRKD